MRLIDADAFKNDIMKHMKKPVHSIFGLIAGIEEAEFLETLCKDIDKRPTIEPETEEEAYGRGYTAGQMAQRKTGRWEMTLVKDLIGFNKVCFRCSECNGVEDSTSPFCRMCGAKMEEGDHE